MKRSSWVLGIRVAGAAMIASLALPAVLLGNSGASASPLASDPTVSGPIAPSDGIEPFTLSTTFNLADEGYEQSEYFLSGSATSYVPSNYATCKPSCTAGPTNGQWSVVPYSTAPYTTRVVVDRPIDPR